MEDCDKEQQSVIIGARVEEFDEAWMVGREIKLQGEDLAKFKFQVDVPSKSPEP